MSKTSTSPFPANRLGLHYFPDTVHYRETDLQTWLPVLQELGASWLVLRSELDRAIPESFLRGLKQARVEPVIQFSISLELLPDLKGIGTLLEVYGRWGARYVIFFDRPNARASWPAQSWAQQDLVERFLDRYVPLANMASQFGLNPVFPPLEPGGSYWDTAFLQTALQALQRRKQDLLLQNLVLAAYAWTGEGLGSDGSLDWGAGGPLRWTNARPYQTPADSQDQRGFRIFDWYLSIVQSVLHEPRPVILLQAGLRGAPVDAPDQAAGEEDRDAVYASITRLQAGERVARGGGEDGDVLEPMPASVISCNIWLLAAEASSPYSAQALFKDDGTPHPAAAAIQAWQRERVQKGTQAQDAQDRAIQHYLLLPGFEWGVSDWYLEVIRPFVKKHRPTVGFSAEEAVNAARVTVVGNVQNYSEDLLSRLTQAGCVVEQIIGDGTFIATQLAER